MTRAEALKQADDTLTALIASGDEEIFKEVTRPDGTVDHVMLVAAALRARERLADSILLDFDQAARARLNGDTP